MNAVTKQARSSCCQDSAIRSVIAPRTSLVSPRIHAIGNVNCHFHATAVVARPRALRAASAVAESAPPAQPVTDKPSEPAATRGGEIKIARSSDVKAIAGKIAHTVREGGAPTALCIGPTCTYTGVKAIAIARQYLSSDNLDLSFQPEIVIVGQDGEGKPLTAVTLKIIKAQGLAAPTAEGPEAVEMHIPGQGKHWLSAASLVKRVEEGRPVYLTAIGLAATFKAALTLEKARKYLAKEGKDLRAVPSFVKVETKDKQKEVAAMRFDVVAMDA